MSESKKPAEKTKKPAAKKKAKPVFELAPKEEKPIRPHLLPWKVDLSDWKTFIIDPEDKISDLQKILEAEPPAKIAADIVKRIGELVGVE